MSARAVFRLCVALGISLPAASARADAIPADRLPEPAITAAGIEGDYLRQLHQHVHKRWADNFLRQASEKLPLQNPVNDPTRTATAELVLTGEGAIVSLALSKAGGFPGFDDAVIEILHDAVPFPAAPLETRSDDNLVHLRWTFARDERRCSGAVLLHVEDPLATAVPKLLRDGREAEVLRRIRAARAAGTPIEPMMTIVATHWLKAVINAPYATAQAAELLASLGDGAGTRWLQLAVKRPEWALLAGQALAARHVPICPLVGASFDGRIQSAGFVDQQSAALALSAAGETACAPGLIKLLGNPKAGREARVAAAVALGSIDDAAARGALADATKDPAASVRAAATLAAVRPGSGRRRVFSLVPALRDPSPEVRAAAAAGVVRASGDANLDDLYVVFKDSDPRPAEAVAKELDHLKSEESTKFLVRLLKRPQLSVQLAAARALVKRHAREWYTALAPFLDRKTDADLRGLALVAADDATLTSLTQALAQSAESGPKITKQALALYRARLARGERAPAADLLIATIEKLPPAARADEMSDWLTSRDPLSPAAAVPPPRAAHPTPPVTAGRTARKR
jgi:HEAT repeat protein